MFEQHLQTPGSASNCISRQRTGRSHRHAGSLLRRGLVRPCCDQHQRGACLHALRRDPGSQQRRPSDRLQCRVGQKGMCHVKCPICLAKACFYSVPRYIPTLAFERIGPSEDLLSARVSSIRENANASHGPSLCPNRKRHIL